MNAPKPLLHILAGAGAVLWSLALCAAPAQKLTLQYDASRNGTVMVEVTERLEHDGKNYTVSYEARGKGAYALVRSGAVKRASKGTVTANGLRPDEFRDKRGDRPEKTARFDWVKRTLQQGEEGKAETKPMPVRELIADRVSLFWSFAFRPPTGKEVAFAVADGGGVDDFRFVLSGTETLKTAAGDIEALKLVKVREGGDERGTEIWLAVKQNYIPVRMLVIEKDGTRIDQVVTSISAQ